MQVARMLSRVHGPGASHRGEAEPCGPHGVHLLEGEAASPTRTAASGSSCRINTRCACCQAAWCSLTAANLYG